MTDLILDIGNSRTKAALFKGAQLLALKAFANEDRLGFLGLIDTFTVQRAALGSVAGDGNALVDALRQRDLPVIELTAQSPAPIRSAYSTMPTLGVDRWANAAAAAELFTGRAALAIDLGTCITYDLIDAAGCYLGGAITPGGRMRARAMHAYSARLPLIEPNHAASPFGDSTTASLQAGLAHGVLGELEHFIGAARSSHADLGVVLTGGDALPQARALKNGIFAHPFLTLEGLRIILHHGLGV